MLTTKTQDAANAAFKKPVRGQQSTKEQDESRAARVAEDQKIERLRTLRLSRIAEETPAPVKRKTRGG
jgi:hypothetical protein